MEFDIFADKIMELLQEKMGEDYQVRLTKVMKNNDIQLTGVVMMRESDKISPTIYLEAPYRRYQEGTDMQEIIDQITALYEDQIRDISLDMNFFTEFDCVKDRIFYKVIHYGKNRKLLEDVPHFKWCDLAVVFYYAMEEEILGRASILLHNNHLEIWGQTAAILYQTAQDNMKRSLPELLVPMQQLLEELTGIKSEKTEEAKLYVLTNKERMYGASAMLYSEKIKELSERLQSDLLILPSSVHEVLVLPDEQGKQYDFYYRMVEEVNTTQVDPEEILSYSLYRYSREKAEIEEIFV